jgi:hypothetical protein
MIEYDKYLDTYRRKIITYHFYKNYCIRKEETIAEDNVSRFSCNPIKIDVSRRLDRKYIGISIYKIAHLVR